MSCKLTLLVFLKDRADFSERLCQFLHNTSYPFPVYFADGSLGNKNEKFFKNLKKTNFRYTYKRFEKDESLFSFYCKTFEAISEIKTPYVMIADNDDFPISESQSQAIEFLENNRGYVGCNGAIGALQIYPDQTKPYGDSVMFFSRYCSVMDAPLSFEKNTAVDRISDYNKNFTSIYYSVLKTPLLTDIFREIKKQNFSDLGVWELFISYMILMQGKVKNISSLIYIRQKGSSQAAAEQPSWFMRLFYTNWLQDLKNAIQIVAVHIAAKEEIDRKIVFDVLYKKFTSRFAKKYEHRCQSKLCIRNIYRLVHRLSLKIYFYRRLICLISRFSLGAAWGSKYKLKHIEKSIIQPSRIKL